MHPEVSLALATKRNPLAKLNALSQGPILDRELQKKQLDACWHLPIYLSQRISHTHNTFVQIAESPLYNNINSFRESPLASNQEVNDRLQGERKATPLVRERGHPDAPLGNGQSEHLCNQ